jgi:hypothetical protein
MFNQILSENGSINLLLLYNKKTTLKRAFLKKNRIFFSFFPILFRRAPFSDGFAARGRKKAASRTTFSHKDLATDTRLCYNTII